jgi:DHA1 family multidrug resistance protein-like MFS transporter
MSSAPSAQAPAAPRSQNLRALALRSFLYGLQINMVRAVWQPFALYLGASMPLLGLMESIGGFSGIVSTAMLPLGGWLSDRRGRKPFVVLASMFGLAALATYTLAGWVKEWRLLLPGVVLLGLTAIARPALDSITAESAPAHASGQAFGLTSMAFAASGIFAPTLGGLLADRYGFLAALVTGAVMELITLCVVGLSLRETLPSENRAVLRASELFALLRTLITPPARLRSFYVTVSVDLFAFGMGAALLFGLLSETYGFTPLQLGLMSSVHSATWAILQLFVGRQVDKRGSVPFLILSEAIASVVIVGWLVFESYSAFLILHGLLGFAVATWVPAFMTWITRSVPENQRAEEIGRLGAFRGLLSFPAPYIGGLLYNLAGFRGPMLANLIGALVVTFLFWRFVPEPQIQRGEEQCWR